MKEGELFVVAGKKKKVNSEFDHYNSGKPRRIILFNDMILVTRLPLQKGKEKGKSQFRSFLSLKSADLINHQDSESTSFIKIVLTPPVVKNGFEILTPENSLWLCAESLENKTEWMNEFKGCINATTEKQRFHDGLILLECD